MAAPKPSRVPRMDPDIDPRADALALVAWVEENGTALAPIADWRTVCHNLRSAIGELGGPDDAGSRDGRRADELEALLRSIGRWVQAGGEAVYLDHVERRIKEALDGR